MTNKTSVQPPLEISQDGQSYIWLDQFDGEIDNIIVLSPDQAMKLAYRLMSFASGQGPSEVETILDEKL